MEEETKLFRNLEWVKYFSLNCNSVMTFLKMNNSVIFSYPFVLSNLVCGLA